MVDRVFLDSNVLFSAAHHPLAQFRRLWTLTDVEQLTSPYAIVEVFRNLPRTRHEELRMLLRAMTVVPTPVAEFSLLPPALTLPEKDVPIFQSAAAAKATHLLTGDKRHFGAYLGQEFEGVLILTPGAYLDSRS